MTPATAENGVCEKVSSPYDVNDLLQVFFEKNKEFFYDWCAFRMASSTDISAIQRIYDWFKGKPDVLLEFRREVLLFPGVAVPIPYNFDELIWIEAIYGGRIELDVKLLSDVSGDETLSRRMKLGFKKLYGITFDEYLDEFKDAPADVIDILNKRANVTHMYHWTDQHEWHHIRQLFSTRQCESGLPGSGHWDCKTPPIRNKSAIMPVRFHSISALLSVLGALVRYGL